jgi:iron complex outermembrane receptor protein
VDPSFCAADLATLGLTASPREFSSDSLWAYELGTKNSLMDGAVVLDLNAYYIKWKNIQQSVRLPGCSFAFISNLGEASGKGADLSLALRPTQGLQLGASLGYNLTEYDKGVTGGNGLIIKQEGDRIGGPKLTGSVFGMAEKQLSAAIEGYLRFDYTFQGSRHPAETRWRSVTTRG